MRKIVQIASSCALAKNGEIITTLCALSDDGIVFMVKSGKPEWEEMPTLPQPKEVKT